MKVSGFHKLDCCAGGTKIDVTVLLLNFRRESVQICIKVNSISTVILRSLTLGMLKCSVQLWLHVLYFLNKQKVFEFRLGLTNAP